MKFHIVRNDETLEDILFLYNLTKDELVEQNRHIRVWTKLVPGTKLKIPPISDAVEQEVSDMEPFVEDYYPKVNEEKITNGDATLQDNQEEKIIDETEEQHIIDENIVDSGQDQINKGEELEVATKVVENQPIVDNKENVKEETEYKEKENTVVPPAANTVQYIQPVMPNYYPYYLGYYNYPRYVPYPIIYYPIYYQK